MNDFDIKSLEQSFEEYKKYVNNKHWADLTSKDLEYVTDVDKKKKYKECLRYVINSLLYHMKNERSFKFSNQDEELTCRNMLIDIFAYYEKLGFDKKSIAEIACDKSNKKY